MQVPGTSPRQHRELEKFPASANEVAPCGALEPIEHLQLAGFRILLDVANANKILLSNWALI